MREIVVPRPRRDSHPAPRQPKRLPPGTRREQLIDAALRVFGRRHPSAVTFEEIADEARVSRPLVYVYFPDRDALSAAVIERAVKLLGQCMSRVSPTIDGMAGALPVRAYLEFGRDNPDAFRQIAGLAAMAANPQVGQIYGNWIEVGAEQLGGGPAARLLVAGVAGFLRGVTTWWVARPEVDLDEVTRIATDALAGLDRVGARFSPPPLPGAATPAAPRRVPRAIGIKRAVAARRS